MEKPTTKICCYCGKELPVSDFWKDKSHKDGLKSRCRKCIKIIGNRQKAAVLYSIGFKICRKCGEKKPLSEFYRRNNGTHFGRCKKCCARNNPKTIEVENLLSKGLKRCTKCGEIKSLSEYPKNKSKKCGVDSRCKYCLSEKYKANKESIRIKRKLDYEANKEKYSERSKLYYKKNKEKIKSHAKEYNHNHYWDDVEKSRKESSLYAKKYCKELHLLYIRARLISQGFSPSDITPDLIAEKRAQLKLERAYRLLNKEIKNQQNKEQNGRTRNTECKN